MAATFSATEHQMNLSVLQNKDPFIKSIEDSASQVAAYSFNSLTNEWEKTNIEGTLFVYTRTAAPTYGFTIMNRLYPTDLVEPINKNLEFQLQDPFLLYRNSKSAIYGIWFYDQEECARIGRLMNSLVHMASGERREERRVSDGEVEAPAATVDILQLLSKAQDEYDKTKHSETKKNHCKQDAAIFKADKGSTADIKHPTATHISLDQLFKKAQLHSNNHQSIDQKLVCGGSNSAFRLPAPTSHKQPTPTVEQIERQVRHQSPNTTLKKTLNLVASNAQAPLNTTTPSKSKLPDKKPPKTATTTTTITPAPVSDTATTNILVQALFSQQKQQQPKPPSTTLTTSNGQSNTASHLPPNTAPHLPKTPPPSHLSHSSSSTQNHVEAHLPFWLEPERSASTLLSPLALQNNSKVQQKLHTCVRVAQTREEVAVEEEVSPLNKEQLKQALITLIKTDTAFLTAIHKAYVDTLNREICRKQ